MSDSFFSIQAGRLLSHAPYKLYSRQGGSSLAAFSTVLTRSTSTEVSGPQEPKEGRALPADDPDRKGRALPADDPDRKGRALPADDPDGKGRALPADDRDRKGRALPADDPDRKGRALPVDDPDMKGRALPADDPDGKGTALPADDPDGKGTALPADDPDGKGTALPADDPDEKSKENGQGELLEKRAAGEDFGRHKVDFENMADNFSPELEGEVEAVGSESYAPADNLASRSMPENCSHSSLHLSTTQTHGSSAIDGGENSSKLAVSRPNSSKTSSSASSPSKNKSPAKAGDPKFLSEFYSHSRLHHISTWGAEFRAYINKLQKESGGRFVGRDRLRQFHVERMVEKGLEQTLESSKRGKPPRVVMHIDMDCFFVSVGLLSHPEHRGG